MKGNGKKFRIILQAEEIVENGEQIDSIPLIDISEMFPNYNSFLEGLVFWPQLIKERIEKKVNGE